MADNDASKIRYDDFIGNVQPDPAKPESTIMLSGFVGHGPDGHARVYPDPTLGSWYDIPEGDILHSMPIADSKLGGSYVWVRASSEIKPGSAAPVATEAEAVQPQQAAAVGMNPTPRTHCRVCDPPMAAAAMQPTPTVQTHCFICPPHTLAVHCWTAPVVCDTMQMPTPATRCFICPPQHPTPLTVPPWVCGHPGFTPATVCTHAVHCPTQPVVCNLQPTQPVVCGVLPPSFGCTQQGCAPGAAGAPQVQAGAFEGATVICSQPARCTQACMPQAAQAGLGPNPHTVGGGAISQCFCVPTHFGCPPNTVNTPCATFVCPTLGACPTVAACTPNGVFTPFGR
jgi:hypothetical protein